VNPLQTVATAVAVFTGTNVDGMVVLTALFLSERGTGRPASRHIWLGEYLGLGAIVAFSIIAAAGLSVVPIRTVRLLGIAPLALGLRGLIRAFSARSHAETRQRRRGSGTASVVAITLASGTDNFTVYTPLFRASSASAVALTVGVFGVLVAVWCGVAQWLTSRPGLSARLDRAGTFVVPCVYVIVGALLLRRSSLVSHRWW